MAKTILKIKKFRIDIGQYPGDNRVLIKIRLFEKEYEITTIFHLQIIRFGIHIFMNRKDNHETDK